MELGTSSLGGYRDRVQAPRDGVRKAKTHLKWNRTRDVKSNKEGFYKSASSKGKTRENVGLLLNGAVALVMKDTEEAKLLNAFFTSVFAGKGSLQEHQASETKENIWSKEDSPLVEQDPAERNV